MTTPRENYLKVFKHERPDWIPTYIGCEVDPRWHRFHTFAIWYSKNFYQCNETLCLDKDFIKPGNKVYSPETCCFLPNSINVLLQERPTGEYLPGVNKSSNHTGYSARYSDKHLGYYKTQKEAHLVYLKAKKEILISLLNEWKTILPKKVYKILNPAMELTNFNGGWQC